MDWVCDGGTTGETFSKSLSGGRVNAYLLVSGDTFVHVPHKNMRSLLPLGLNPLPLVSFKHPFPARVHFESSEALHPLDSDPGDDLRDPVLL